MKKIMMCALLPLFLLSLAPSFTYAAEVWRGGEFTEDMLWDGNKYVSVLSNGTIRTSMDGYVWRTALHGKTSGAALYSVAFNGSNAYVAVGSQSLKFSVDGYSWQSIFSYDSARIYTPLSASSVIWDGQQFLIISYDFNSSSYLAHTSVDGKLWVKHQSSNIPNLNYPVKSIAFNGTKYLAIYDFTGSIISSTDGLTWVAENSNITNNLQKVKWLGGKFVAVGDAGTILTSIDGVTWTRQVSNTSASILDVTWTGSQYIASGRMLSAVNGSTQILTSADGVTWLLQPTNLTLNYLSSVASNGVQVVAYGYGSLVSGDSGVTWNLATDVDGSNGALKRNAVWDGQQFIGVGAIKHFNQNINGSGIYTSPDGVAWTLRSANLVNYWHDVAWSGTRYVAVGDYPNQAAIATSVDGVNWTLQPPIANTFTLYGVVWAGTQFIAVGGGSQVGMPTTVLTSPDGLTWTLQSTGIPGGLQDVSWNGTHIFITTNVNGVSANIPEIWSSIDGVLWFQVMSGLGAPTRVEKVLWTGTEILAKSGTNLLSSTDGISWFTQSTASPFSFSFSKPSGGLWTPIPPVGYWSLAHYVWTDNVLLNLGRGIYAVSDTVAPVISPLTPLQVEATAVSTPIAWGDLKVTDNIDSDLTVTTDQSGPFPIGNTNVLWSVTDASGNIGTQLQSIMVQDTTAPVIQGTPLADVIVQATGVNTSVTLVPPTATDIFAVTMSSDAPATFPIGTTVVTWTATDANGNVSTAAQNVVVQDTTAPVIQGTPLADVIVQATGVNTSVTLVPPTATDIFAVTMSSDAPATFPIGTTVVTWTATDANGNVSTAAQNVVIQDTTANDPTNSSASSTTSGGGCLAPATGEHNFVYMLWMFTLMLSGMWVMQRKHGKGCFCAPMGELFDI